MVGKFGPKNRHCSTGLYLVPYEPCGKISKSRITLSLNLRTCLASLWGFIFSVSKHTGLRHFKTACNLAPNTGFCYQTKEDGGWHGRGEEKGHETWRGCHDRSYSPLQEGKVLSICSITSVRSVLVSWGGASRSSDAETQTGKAGRLRLMPILRPGENIATSPQKNINGIGILIEKNKFTGK